MNHRHHSNHGSSNRRQPAHVLFPQPGVYRPQNFKTRHTKQSRNRNFSMGLAFLFAMLTIFGVLGWIKKSHTQDPFTLIEIRALEESGHPVTGAKVVIDGKNLGVTDSFGEWRRYLRIPAGKQVEVKLSKEGNPSYQGARTLRVPKKKIDDKIYQLKASIELQALANKKIASKSRRQEPAVPPDEQAESEDFGISRERELAKNEELSNRLKPEEDPTAPHADSDLREVASDERAEPGDSLGSSVGPYFDDGLTTISVQAVPSQSFPSNLLERHQAEVLQSKIVPLLSKELQNLDLRVDRQATWKVSLTYVPKKDQVGYIRAAIHWQNPFGQMEKTAFIAGFAKTFEETTRALTSLLRMHMKKSFWAFKDNGGWFIDEAPETKAFWRLRPGMVLLDTNGARYNLTLHQQRDNIKRWKLAVYGQQPCATVRQRLRCLVSTQSIQEAPPLAGWKQRSILLQGAIPSSAEVFVAGFQALPIGDGRWSYWGHPGSNHKILVLDRDKIVHSEVFVDKPSTQTVVRIMPSSSSRQARR